MPAKKIPPFVPIILWIIAGLFVMELVAKIIHLKGQGASAHYSANWEMREVSECFHNELWDTPWMNYLPEAEVSFNQGQRAYHASINSIGFRGPELTNKPSTKIACFGGSTTVNGPTNEETYPALLESFLNKKLKSYQVEIINCGVAGMDSSSYHRSFKTLSTNNTLPDIVLEYNGINSICWQLIPFWNSQIHPIKKILLKSYFIKYVFGDLFLPDKEKIAKDIQDFCIADLKRLEAQLEEKGIKLCVASFLCPNPTLASKDEMSYLDFNMRYWWRSDYISYKNFYQIVQIYNDELKSAFYDTPNAYLPLAEYGDFGPDAFFDICHMKPEGIQKKAFILSRLLRPALKQMKK